MEMCQFWGKMCQIEKGVNFLDLQFFSQVKLAAYRMRIIHGEYIPRYIKLPLYIYQSTLISFGSNNLNISIFFL